MSVAAHLGIDLAEYDARIRTFIPEYDEMLDAAAGEVPRHARLIVDLGTGTGALGLRCLERLPHARLVGVDEDTEILTVAAARLGSRASFVAASFLRAALPRCDAIVASLALHHVRTRRAKARLYRRIRAALRPRGRILIVDCHPAADPVVAAGQIAAWRKHLRRTYDSAKTKALLNAWAREDVYVPLEHEIQLLAGAGMRPEVLWRKGPFAVIAGIRGSVATPTS